MAPPKGSVAPHGTFQTPIKQGPPPPLLHIYSAPPVKGLADPISIQTSTSSSFVPQPPLALLASAITR